MINRIAKKIKSAKKLSDFESRRLWVTGGSTRIPIIFGRFFSPFRQRRAEAPRLVAASSLHFSFLNE